MTERDIFIAAVQIAADAERADYLSSACAGRPELRERVEELLRLHAHAGDFLDRPPTALDGTVTLEPSAGDDPAEAPGTAVGPYRLLEVIGEGGMGVVYAAEQRHPVRRRVAVKVVRPGMDTRQVVARFEAERQALALMDHPNIAKVLDAGATAAGRPYFAMELVRGLPVTTYCDQARLAVPDRLELVAGVCRAVQHAHQKGVIHRDLKPSNVLITVIDGKPVPKVIDFGIAKATGGALTERTLHTGHFQLVGTPLYMAPEQAELSGVDVDTRADVYSLGVLLYELLTGTTPFDGESLRRAGLDEVRRIIREDEPDRPSRRVGTLTAEQASTVADRRRVDPRQLGWLMRSELDWVVMKALDKDRDRRYQSPAELADDVERYLADQPVAARPPSARYRFGKFARRNRAALALATVLAAAVLAAAGGVGWGLQNAAARRGAVEQRAGVFLEEAERRAGQGGWADALAEVEKARAAADAGGARDEFRRRVDELHRGLKLVARLEHVRFGYSATVANGNFDHEWLDRAYARAFREAGVDVDALPPNEVAPLVPAAVRVPVASALDLWAVARRRGPAGEDGARQLHAAAHAVHPDDWLARLRDAAPRKDRAAMTALAAEAAVDGLPVSHALRLARALRDAGAADEALAHLRACRRRHPDDFWANFELAAELQDSRPQEAARFYTAAIALKPDSAGAYNNLGNTLAKLGDRAEAVAAYGEAVRLKPDYTGAYYNLSRADPKHSALREGLAVLWENTRARPNDADAHFMLGSALEATGDHAGAAAAAREAVRLRPDFADALNTLSNALRHMGDLDEAAAAARDFVRLAPGEARAHLALGNALRELGDRAGAVAAFQQAIRLRPGYSLAHSNLGAMHERAGRMAEAEAEFREAARLDPTATLPRHNLGLVLVRVGRPAESLAVLRETIRLDPGDAVVRYTLGNALRDTGDLDGAAAAFREAARLNPGYGEAHCNLGHVLRRQGKFAEAAAAFRRGHEAGSKDPKWTYPSAEWVADAERLAAAGPRVVSVLRGESDPADAREALAVAWYCEVTSRYATAARCYRQALSDGTGLLSEEEASRRWDAVQAAVRAGCGQGEDAAGLGEEERAGWLRQALAWLRPDFDELKRVVAGGDPGGRREVRERLIGLKRNEALACVRDPAGLAKLPTAERAKWEGFWTDVEALLARTEESLGLPAGVRADDPEPKGRPAAELLAARLAQAKAGGKAVFLAFGSPSCEPCTDLDKFHARPAVKKTLGRHLVFVTVDVVDTPGGKDLYKKYTPPSGGGVPVWVVLSAAGEVLADSFEDKRKNVGFPYQANELAHYEKAMRAALPKLTDDEVALLMRELKASGPEKK